MHNFIQDSSAFFLGRDTHDGKSSAGNFAGNRLNFVRSIRLLFDDPQCALNQENKPIAIRWLKVGQVLDRA